ncbi:MAG: nucleoside-diphosphate sugar epimerase/dehydratase [Wenzhouxiangellaceae bacterium]|nr:nucleoside-diphosphate sugar epimerase/dehydratase [Wenzhouxiangellaceae bacterium]
MKVHPLKRIPRYQNARVLVIIHDLIVATLAWLIARWLAQTLFLAQSPDAFSMLLEGSLLLAMQAFVYWRIGLYRGLWRFASLPDLGNLLRVSLLGAIAVGIVLLIMEAEANVVAPLLWLYPVLLLVSLGLPRLAFRIFKDMRTEVRWRRTSQRTLILGAGRSGRLLVTELRRRGDFELVGFLDDDERLRNSEVDGIPVLGSIARLPRITREAAIDLVVIAIPSATNSQMQRIVQLCERSGVEFKTLPTLKELGASITRFGELKPVAIDDLLGREPVSLDWNAIRSGLAGKRVLVTGGGGSIGAELCRQIARLDPAGLVILDRSEYNLYRIDYQLRNEFCDLVMDSVLGDVCDSATVENVIARHKPEVIFHAAAYKHLPMLQNQVREAFRNNVLGTVRMADAATRHQVKTLVLISTDKAVNPCNVMGATKRIAELYCQQVNSKSETRFITVRFGNVLNSTGSVVPLFNEQIRKGGPVTVTHPEISRYFMTIAEAGQLIMQAAVLGEGGEVFVLDMGEPVRISYLAEQLIRLAGKEPGKDIEIVYTGLRPGEKLYEELFHAHESYAKTGHQKILLARNGHRSIANLETLLKASEAAVRQYDSSGLRKILMQLVPEMDRVPPNQRKVVPLN